MTFAAWSSDSRVSKSILEKRCRFRRMVELLMLQENNIVKYPNDNNDDT